MVLLVGAGLMIRTLANMNAVNLGFNPVGVLTLRVPIAGSRAEPHVAAFWRDLVKSVEALPGVRSASVARGLPIESWSGQFFVNQDQPNPPAGHVPDANYVVVGPRYFETMQMPLRAGRPFDDRDTAGGLPVVIVNEELARTQWPGQNAIGRRIKMGGPSDTHWPWLTVVGVAGSAMTQGPQSGVRAEVYVPYQQYPWLLVPQHLVVRASPGTAPASLTRSIVAEIERLDRDLPATDIRTMEEVAALPMGQQRMVMALLGGFAGVALVLAALGIYSVLSYSVGSTASRVRRPRGARRAAGRRRAARRGRRCAPGDGGAWRRARCRVAADAADDRPAVRRPAGRSCDVPGGVSAARDHCARRVLRSRPARDARQSGRRAAGPSSR